VGRLSFPFRKEKRPTPRGRLLHRRSSPARPASAGADSVQTALTKSDAIPTPDPSPADARDIAGVVAPPPLIYLAGLAIGFGLEALLPGASLPGALRWIGGGVLVLAGAALLATFSTAFTRRGTAVDPWKPTTAIVTTGPYRLTRNPAYLGMALVYVGIALLAEALWVLVPLPVVLVVVDRGVIAREERYLGRKFGREYLDYKAGVRRWF
jgi:protein-S-isoprenylcysteine O-methyltransferase Ste14